LQFLLPQGEQVQGFRAAMEQVEGSQCCPARQEECWRLLKETHQEISLQTRQQVTEQALIPSTCATEIPKRRGGDRGEVPVAPNGAPSHPRSKIPRHLRSRLHAEFSPCKPTVPVHSLTAKSLAVGGWSRAHPKGSKVGCLRPSCPSLADSSLITP